MGVADNSANLFDQIPQGFRLMRLQDLILQLGEIVIKAVQIRSIWLHQKGKISKDKKSHAKIISYISIWVVTHIPLLVEVFRFQVPLLLQQIGHFVCTRNPH